MSHEYSAGKGRVPLVKSPPGIWIAYIAATWAFLFAAMSFYWAAGGTIGLTTLSTDIVMLAHNSWFLVIVWGTAIMKVLAGVLALGLVKRWGSWLPQWFLLAANYIIGGFMVLYGGVNLMVRGLMAIGILNTPASMLTDTAQWHFVWDLWWLAGGILFCTAAWQRKWALSATRRN